MLANSAAIRRAVAKWHDELPPAERLAIKALNEVRQQAAENLERQADRWTTENKLVHAGAARKLAFELKQNLSKEKE
jgi:hypothetical protein